MKNEKILQIEHLSKTFGEKQVIDDVELSVFSGELLAVVGPSGCGKTTLLRLIAGLEKPEAGTIKLGKEFLFSIKPLVVNLEPYKRNIGIVFQNYALWPNKNAFQNVAYPLQVRGYSGKQQRERVAAILKQVRMTGFEKRYPHQLSSGEQQRIALARALVIKPRLLLLDEPLSNLDAHLRDKMGDEIKRIQQETRITIIHVTHDQAEAMKLANRISVMNRGRIVQTDSPKLVYQQPGSKFVAGFIGVSNLITCPVLEMSGNKLICLPDGSTLNLDHEPDNHTKMVTLVVRPEDVTIHGSGTGEPGTIQDIAYRGNLFWYRLMYAGTEIKVQTTYKLNFEVGDEVWISIHRATVLP